MHIRARRFHRFCYGLRKFTSFVAVSTKTPLDLIPRLIACVSVLLLDQAYQSVLLATDPFEIIIGELAPPRFQCAPHFFPLSGKYVFVHDLFPLFQLEISPNLCAPAQEKKNKEKWNGYS